MNSDREWIKVSFVVVATYKVWCVETRWGRRGCGGGGRGLNASRCRANKAAWKSKASWHRKMRPVDHFQTFRTKRKSKSVLPRPRLDRWNNHGGPGILKNVTSSRRPGECQRDLMLENGTGTEYAFPRRRLCMAWTDLPSIFQDLQSERSCACTFPCGEKCGEEDAESESSFTSPFMILSNMKQITLPSDGRRMD